MMTAREKELAQFFARLASIPIPTERMNEVEASRFEKRLRKKRDQEWQQRASVRRGLRAHTRYEWKMSGFDTLPKAEWRALAQHFVKISSYVRRDLAKGDTEDRTERSKVSEKADVVWLSTKLDLPQLHRKVRQFLGGLFDGLEMPLAWLYQDHPTPPTVRLRLENGRLRERPVGADPHEHLLGDFVLLLRLTPFPFGRCPKCGTVFVRVKRQRYCSRICATQYIEAARKGTRREYMRELMRRKRERERQKRERKGL
jgi:hypothetical protein